MSAQKRVLKLEQPDPFSTAQRRDLEGLVEGLREEIAKAAQEAARVEPLAPLLSIDGACKAFGVSRSQFDRWLADSTSGLRPLLVPIGRRWRVPTEEFWSWILSQRGHTQSPARDGRRVAN